MHINDNDLQNDLHLALGKGNIDYSEFTEILIKNQMDVSVLVEVSDIEGQISSLVYMKENGIYPYI